MHVRENEGPLAPPPAAAAPEPSAPKAPALPLWVYGRGYGLTDGRTDADTSQHPVRGSTLW